MILSNPRCHYLSLPFKLSGQNPLLSLLSLHMPRAHCNWFFVLFIFLLINTAFQSTQALPIYYSLHIIYGLF